MSASRSFASRLSTTIVNIVNLLFVLAIAVSFVLSYRMAKREAYHNAESQLEIVSLDIENTLNELQTVTQALSFLVDAHNADTLYLHNLLERVVGSHPLLVGASVSYRADFFPGQHYCAPYVYEDLETGELVSMSLGNAEYDYHNIDWYQLPVLLKKPVWSEPYYDESASNATITTYAIPLFEENGEPYAVVTADIALDWLHDKIAERHPFEGSYTILIGRSGRYVSHRDSERIMKESIFNEALETGNAKALQFGKQVMSGQKGLARFNDEGTRSFAAYAPLSNGWTAALICPFRSVFSNLNKLLLLYLLVALIGVMVLYAVIKRIINRESLPITEFTYSALNMAKGNFHTTFPEVKTKDELLRLRDSLSYMQKSVSSYIHELRTTSAANERYESELNIARNIQMGMVPTNFPQRREVDLHASLIPAREVGGDLYDFVVADKTLYFAIGDVSGKGVPAALLMAICRSAVRFVAGRTMTMGEVMESVNRILCDGNDNSLFVTLFNGRLNLKTGLLEYCNAGHNPLVLIPPSGEPTLLKPKSNLAVGLIRDFTYEPEEIQLTPGTRLLLYTDGVTEAENNVKEFFGNSRLLDYAAHLDADASEQAVTEGLVAAVKAFTGDNEQNDDITIMSFKYNGYDETI